ncbi:ATP/GTP-binding protein [Tomitella cavernea]|uniref:ATP-binding protein n=1 Tax=Tomitella cavernea TaxID=1387982 RepID=A0ABP9D332_9ACTN|nr:ATP/GTP-binding protein [Tomitella cavernea]
MTITRDTERPTRGGEDAAAAGGSSAGLPWHTIVPFYSLLARRTTTAVPDAPENPESAARRRPPPRRSKWLDRWGWYEHRAAGAYTTTRQAEVLNLATQRRDARSEGVLFGLNKLSQSLVIIDPFALYGDEIENINVCAIGDIGKGKSSGIKTGFVLRQIAAGRRVVVLDKKRQGASGGEYTPIARELGAASVRFRTGGGGASLNLLDPAIAATGQTGGGVDPAGQNALVAAVLEDTMGRTLSEREYAALNRGLRVVTGRAAAAGVEATAADLAGEMLSPSTRTADGDVADDFGELWEDEARRWGRDPGLALRRLCDGDLKGLVDQPTSPDVRAALEHPLVHFDVSEMPTKGPALRVIMTVIHTWLANVLATRADHHEQTLLVVEEGWHIAGGSTGQVFHDNMKLSRGLGLSTVSAFHHISDLPAESPARALMKEAGIVLLYGQERYEDAAEAVAMYHLPPGTEETLMNLPKGHCLVKYGSQDPMLVEHVRSSTEQRLTDTDAIIKGEQ